MLNLKIQKRETTGRKVKKMRQEDILPGVLYGSDFKSKPVKVDYKEFDKAYQKGGESTILNLDLNGKSMKALIYEVQYDVLTGDFQHVDFYKIKKGEKIQVDVDLKFIGTPPAVKKLGGSFIANLDQIEIECLPKDLIHEIEIDVSVLETFDDVIRVKDLSIPENVKVLSGQDEVVAKVAEVVEEEEVLEEVEEDVADKVGVVGEEKGEEDEKEASDKEKEPKKEGSKEKSKQEK